MSLEIYEASGARHFDDRRASFVTSSAIYDCDYDVGLIDTDCDTYVSVSCIRASVRRPASTLKNDMDAEEWRTNNDGFIPPMRRLNYEDVVDELDTSEPRTRRGVQVLFSVDKFSSPRLQDEVRTKKSTRKAQWPYRAKS